jgi:hypothetical protein
MTRLIWLIVGSVLVVALAAGAVAGVPVPGLLGLVTGMTFLGLLAYLFRRQEQLTLILTALVQLVLFVFAFGVLMYLGAQAGAPLADTQLQSLDSAVRCDASQLAKWSRNHVFVDATLTWAYHSTLAQTFLVVLLLGLRRDRRSLAFFTLCFVLSLLSVLAVFVLVPAEGPFTGHDCSMSPAQAHYLRTLRLLRCGAVNDVDFEHMDGLVTFPSFHTIWALLLVAAFPRIAARPLVVVINALAIVATLTTGWHYFSDVVAGVALYWVVSAGATWICRKVQHADRLTGVMCFS